MRKTFEESKLHKLHTVKSNWHMTRLIRKSLAKQKLRLQTVYVINSAIFKSLEIHWWVKLLRYDAKGYKSNSYPNSRCKWLNHLCTYRSAVINYVMILLTWCIGIWFNSCLSLCNTVCKIRSNNFWCHSILKFYTFWCILIYVRYNVYSAYVQDIYPVVVVVFSCWA